MALSFAASIAVWIELYFACLQDLPDFFAELLQRDVDRLRSVRLVVLVALRRRRANRDERGGAEHGRDDGQPKLE